MPYILRRRTFGSIPGKMARVSLRGKSEMGIKSVRDIIAYIE